MHQYVNQMTGKIFDIEDIGKYERKQGYFFGCDYTAAIGHVRLPNNADKFCDAIWASAHKFHGPKNQGFIWLSERLFTYLNGNTDPRNNYGLIHGTLDVPRHFTHEISIRNHRPVTYAKPCKIP